MNEIVWLYIFGSVSLSAIFIIKGLRKDDR